MLTREMMDAKLDEHFGYEARDDVEGVLATLTDDVEHDIVGWPLGPSHGPAEARAFYESLFADLADGNVRTVRRHYGEDFLVDESIWSGRVPRNRKAGRPLEFRLLHVLRFAEDGRIAGEQVWLDTAAIARQLG